MCNLGRARHRPLGVLAFGTTPRSGPPCRDPPAVPCDGSGLPSAPSRGLPIPPPGPRPAAGLPLPARGAPAGRRARAPAPPPPPPEDSPRPKAAPLASPPARRRAAWLGGCAACAKLPTPWLNVLPLARPPRGIAAPHAPTLPRVNLQSWLLRSPATSTTARTWSTPATSPPRLGQRSRVLGRVQGPLAALGGCAALDPACAPGSDRSVGEGDRKGLRVQEAGGRPAAVRPAFLFSRSAERRRRRRMVRHDASS